MEIPYIYILYFNRNTDHADYYNVEPLTYRYPIGEGGVDQGRRGMLAAPPYKDEYS